MGENKTNREVVKDYHKKLSAITIRIPQSDIDYKERIQKHAEEIGKSMNEYILSLIETDMKITIPKGVKGVKDTKRGLKIGR